MVREVGADSVRFEKIDWGHKGYYKGRGNRLRMTKLKCYGLSTEDLRGKFKFARNFR